MGWKVAWGDKLIIPLFVPVYDSLIHVSGCLAQYRSWPGTTTRLLTGSLS